MHDPLPEPVWLDDVADKDYDAAFEYLFLKLDEIHARLVIAKLRQAPLIQRRANDTLRACGYQALPLTDPGVSREHAKLGSGKKLSPILVVSFAIGGDIADGFHRLSYAYNYSPYATVPMRLAIYNGHRK
jgi:hypothetical protein